MNTDFHMQMEINLLYCLETKSEVLNIMEQLMNDLNTYFECQIRISKLSYLYNIIKKILISKFIKISIIL